MLLESKRIKYKSILLQAESENLQDTIPDDIFANSVKMSYKYLDQYYLQTREQAQKGFLVTVSVAIGGAFILGIGIISMFNGKTQPAYITAASGVITEFIAAVFFYLYNKTNQSMGTYHNKLVLSQNISLALRLTESLSDTKEQDAVKKDIIIELIKKYKFTYQ